MYAICVTFAVKPGDLDAFLPLMRANATASLANEPGCHRFDVCQNPDTPTEVFLYELYDDRDAFSAHLKAAHFLAFDAATADMLAEKHVRSYSLLTGA